MHLHMHVTVRQLQRPQLCPQGHLHALEFTGPSAVSPAHSPFSPVICSSARRLVGFCLFPETEGAEARQEQNSLSRRARPPVLAELEPLGMSVPRGPTQPDRPTALCSSQTRTPRPFSFASEYGLHLLAQLIRSDVDQPIRAKAGRRPRARFPANACCARELQVPARPPCFLTVVFVCRAAGTIDHSLGAVRQDRLIFSRFRRPEVKIRGLLCGCPLGSGGRDQPPTPVLRRTCPGDFNVWQTPGSGVRSVQSPRVTRAQVPAQKRDELESTASDPLLPL